MSGSYSSVTAVPQNGVHGFQQILTPTVINEIKIGLNGAKTRICRLCAGNSRRGYQRLRRQLHRHGRNSRHRWTGRFGGGRPAWAIWSAATVLRTVAASRTPATRCPIIDSFSVINGQHTLKFGVELRAHPVVHGPPGRNDLHLPQHRQLCWPISPRQIQVLGDTSAPDPFNNGATGNRLLKQYYLIGYAQDEWKIRPNLTMSYGLRYEYYRPLHEDRNLFVLFNANTRADHAEHDSVVSERQAEHWLRAWASPGRPRGCKSRTVFRVGAGYYYGPGQTEDQIQPIDSDRASAHADQQISRGRSYPAQVLAGFNPLPIPTSAYQPRGYPPDEYRMPEKVLSYTASIQQQLPGSTVLTIAYVGSQGRNLFLRSWTNAS